MTLVKHNHLAVGISRGTISQSAIVTSAITGIVVPRNPAIVYLSLTVDHPAGSVKSIKEFML